MISYHTSIHGYPFIKNEMDFTVRRKLEVTFQSLDQALPGTLAALELSCPNFIYDPEGHYHRWVGDAESLFTRSGYFRPEHAIYFSKSGLRKSIPHEIVHLLDSMAGSGRAILFSLITIYPTGTLVDEINMNSFAKTILSGIIGARICADNPTASARTMLTRLAAGGYGMPVTLEMQKMNDFVAERFANLFEQFAFEKLAAAGVKPTCFAKSLYQEAIMWEPEWLLERDGELTALWAEMIGRIMSLSSEQIRQRVQSFCN
jgi:hypothetical protein